MGGNTVRARLTGFGVACLGAALTACASVPPPATERTDPGSLDLSEAPSAEARRITGDEFARLAMGNTLLRRMANGGLMAVHIVSTTEQRLEMRSADGKVAADMGQQVIRDDSVCVTWAKVQAGRQLCFAYFVDRGEIVSVDLDGRISPARFALRPGQTAEATP